MPSDQKMGDGHPSSSRPQGAHGPSHESPNNDTHHVYDNCSAAMLARLLNGDMLSKDITIPSPKNLYKNIRAEDESSVVNGNVDLDFIKVFFGPRRYLDPREITQRGSVYVGGWTMEKPT